ncbi:MAG TPA: histidine--tRNA ligase [Candidatus Moranbacteria bacterium]|nr:MAG: Histidine-tRNA ligase [Candidatus Moranbacteria bacterium GW2011_GWD1_36_198]KKQ01108.1 MAG: Histidine-tRNA ligase [Candidatus Moranbacteria bacterium GW2011_GWD2_36_198]HAR99516.1 histidine--tRNA ligase [Candidatus Moranbacteria bacterium]HBI50513.1 histidine--tRNA ligase [Candidatus Moranbacteria bacterium]HBU10399.1 histidine--tRNA ligase [Candidatus Moranbacteria bacterium]
MNFCNCMAKVKDKIIKKSVAKKMDKKTTAKKAVKAPTAKKVLKEKMQVQEEILMQPPRGMRDLLPGDQPYWNQLRRVLARVAIDYGFQRIDTPAVEYANLFVRSIGKGTDIVDKEMYMFTTKGGDKVALRPELTAGLGRAYIQHGMNVLSKPVKLFSTGPVYRYDRPQEGRYREHFQANFDAFGEQDPILDAQLIQLAHRVVTSLGIKNIQFQVNSIGCPKCRKEYQELLVAYFESKKQKLCLNCKKRLEINPLRILDCKEDKCIQVATTAPQSIDRLCTECRVHFKSLLEYLDELDLPYVINPRLVRGLSYYTKTVFEIWSGDEEGKKHSLGGGGRYDHLIEELGGEHTPAIGFGIGMDRIVQEMKRVHAKMYIEPKPRVFLAQLGDLAKKKSLNVFAELQKNGILTAESFGRGSLKSQLRVADRLGVEITLIIGQKEALDETVIVKDMVSGTQETVNHERLIIAVRKILKNNVVVSHEGE